MENEPLNSSRFEPKEVKKEPVSDRRYYLFALRIVGDFGANIAIPVVVLVLLGQYLDERFNRGSLFTILGFILAALISSKLIYSKVKRYGEQFEKLTNKKD